MTAKIRTAVFDIGSHRALMRLIEGPFVGVEDLALAEEGLRAIVLHDDAIIEPFLFRARVDVENAKNEGEKAKICVTATELTSAEMKQTWENRAGQQMMLDALRMEGQEFILGTTPVQCYGLIRHREAEDIPEVGLSASLRSLAESESHATPGSYAYEIYSNTLKILFGVVQNGGSIVCETEFFRKAVQTASSFPRLLFAELDKDWADFAKNLNTMGPLVPPVLSIVLHRTASRDRIPEIVSDLRDEWSVARAKVWSILDALKTARTLAEAKEIERELEQTSNYFSPFSDADSSRPMRIFWDAFVGGMGGALVAAISGGQAAIGAATAVVGRAISEVQKNQNFGQMLFSRGGFDLARRIRRELNRLERDRLRTFLSETEQKVLGISDS